MLSVGCFSLRQDSRRAFAGGSLPVSDFLVMGAVLGAVLGAVAVLPVVCRPEVGQCPAVSALAAVCAPEGAGTPAVSVPAVAFAPEGAGTLEEAGGEEGAVCSHCKQFCGPIRGRGHSNCRKPPRSMNGHPNRHILRAITTT